jgi:hypothetical protein
MKKGTLLNAPLSAAIAETAESPAEPA